MKKQIPNILTIIRIVSSFIAPYFLVTDHIWIAIIIYIVSAITDFLDGYFARKWNAFTELGQVLDPISDKVLALGVLASALYKGNYYLLVLLPFEIVISIVCGISKYKGYNPYAERVGKIKTALLFPTVILGLLMMYVPVFQFLFYFFLLVSVRLEWQAMISYINQYHRKKSLYQEKRQIESALEKSKELSVNHKQNVLEELFYYLLVNIKLEKKGE